MMLKFLMEHHFIKINKAMKKFDIYEDPHRRFNPSY